MQKIESVIPSSFNRDKCSAKILGSEQNGKYLYLLTYKKQPSLCSICIFQRSTRSTRVLYTSSEKLNVVQASVNSSNTLLAFVTKDKQTNLYNENEKNITRMPKANRYVYRVTGVNVRNGASNIVNSLSSSYEKQIMVQFLYCKKPTNIDRLLVFKHMESITLYELKLREEDIAVHVQLSQTVTNIFSWAQWDAAHQCLFYIHDRKSTKQEDDQPVEYIMVPTLTALQFHDDMPHETVLNIPLKIPKVEKVTTDAEETNVYDDIPVPLRVRDCSSNIHILMQSTGIVYICHYYFFQPVANSRDTKSISTILNQTVHFAYSITVLHHGRVMYCSVPNIDWSRAMDLKPIFCMHGDQHLIVYVSDLFMHVLDVGTDHEPCCHFVLPTLAMKVSVSNVTPLPGTISEVLDIISLDILKVSVSRDQLIMTFWDNKLSVKNQLSILHYIIVHLNNMEMVNEIVSTMATNVANLNNVKLLREILVGGCYSLTSQNIASDGVDLLKSLPLTTNHLGMLSGENINQYTLTLEEEMLCNPSVMLLTPRQRLIPMRTDVWTKLWNHLPNYILTHSQNTRFKNAVIAEKLAISLVCYQPEVLSRCCTPLSPNGPHFASIGMLADVANIARLNKSGIRPLPFIEAETSVASKQEHIISVNLREVSLHLVKLGKSAMKVHAVAMRYVSSQMEISRILCSYLTQAAGIDTERTDRGFLLIDKLPKDRQKVLFALMERYYVAMDGLAFALPQGFVSFFCYLGYRVLPITRFIDYIRINIFQVNIDVIKAIMKDLPDQGDGLKNKLNILLQLPRSRTKRILNQWSHPVSLMIRAREHSMNILSGISGMPPKNTMLSKGIRHGAGLTAFPSSERLSPLDTFLDLLTAKANLTDIDFTLLIDATISSTEKFLNFDE